jgi:Ca2+-binding EF-hand superfamily protein
VARGGRGGGPSVLRRAFQFFDADGSGSIDHAEFKLAMSRRTNLEFSDELVREIMGRIDRGTGVVNFNQFCELVSARPTSWV